MAATNSRQLVGRIRRRRGLVSVLVALALTVALYPEVVLLGGSLSATGLQPVLDRSMTPREVSVLPDVGGTGAQARTRDVGARLWQLEPATKFMHRAIADGESPWWNPYSGGGAYGTETLADTKLSPFVLLVAATGASSTAFTFVALGFIFVSLYCLQQLFTRSLRLPRLAAVAAGLVFVLNGWGISDMTSGAGAPYLVFPIVLYCLVELLRRPGPARFLAAAAAYTALIATTFIPVVLLMGLLIHTVALTVDAWWRRDTTARQPLARRVAVLVGRQAVVPLAAVALTAVVWMPALVALRGSGGDVASYAARSLRSRGWLSWETVLSPLSFRSEFPKNTWTITTGAVVIVLIAATLPRARGLAARLLALTAVLAALGLSLHLGLPVLKELAQLPGLRAIRADYWASLTGAALTLAAGVTIAVARERGVSVKAGLAAGGALGVLVVAGVVTSGLGPGVERLGPPVSLLVIGGTCAILVVGGRRPDRRALLAGVLVAALALELVGYQNRVRVERMDLDQHEPAYVAFLRDHLGDGRVLNAGRNGLYPEWGAALGIRQVEDLNVSQIPAYREFFFDQINPAEVDLLLQVGRDTDVPFEANPSALDLLSVRYLVVDDDLATYGASVADRYPLAFTDDRAGVKVYENPAAFPRAYVSPALAGADGVATTDHEWQQGETTTADQRLLDAASAAGVAGAAPSGAAGQATITEDRNDQVTIDVDADQPSVMVLTDTFQRNWTATVDGEPAHLGPVDDVVRGVVVPQGRSTVVIRYRSPARSVGLWVSALSLVVLLLGAAAWAGRGLRPLDSFTTRSKRPV
ncbi:MAG: hypothetical protein ACXWB2_09210 [Acidimicrobiales bacterium]